MSNTVNNKISIVGGTVTNGTTYKADNLTTAVVGGAVQIQMKESPTFKDITATNGTNTVTVSGTNGTVSGLTNTDWSDTTSGVDSRAGVAATEGQLKSVKTALATSISTNADNITTNANNITANTNRIAANENAISTLSNGFNVTSAATGSGTVDGTSSTAVKAGDTVTLKAGNNLALTQSGSTFTYALQDKVTLGSGANAITLDGVNGTIGLGGISFNGTNNTASIGGVTVNGTNNVITGLSNTTFDASNITSGRAATEDQLKQVYNAVTDTSGEVTNAKFGITAGDGSSVTSGLNKNIAIVGGTPSSTATYSADNITTKVVNGQIQIQMSTTPSFDAVNATTGTVGGVTLADNTVTADAVAAKTVTASDSMTTGTGANAVTLDGTAGTVTAGTGDNAITLNGANGTITAGTGVTLDGIAGTGTFGGITINGGAGGTGTISGLTNTTWNDSTSGTGTRAGVAATEGQLHDVRAMITMVSNDTTSNINTVQQTINQQQQAITQLQQGLTVNAGATNGGTNNTTNSSVTVTQENALTLEAGKNMTVTNGTNGYVFELSPNVSVDSVNASDSVTSNTLTANNTLNVGNMMSMDASTGVFSMGGTTPTIILNSSNSSASVGNVNIDGSSGYVTGLTNTTWDASNYQANRAASEGQIKYIIDELNTGVQISIDGTKIQDIKLDDTNSTTTNSFMRLIRAAVKLAVTDTSSTTSGSTSTDSSSGTSTSSTTDSTTNTPISSNNQINFKSGDNIKITSDGTNIVIAADGLVTNDQFNTAINNLQNSTTHFVSINASDRTSGNYSNDGAAATNSMAFGVGASVAKGADYSVAFGNGATVSADGGAAVAMGNKSSVTAENGVAVGNSASVSGSNGVAIGNSAAASATNGVAIGNGASVTTDQGVAIGSGSVASAPTSTVAMTVAGTSYETAGGTAYSTVSVGASGKERTITNVAAGQVTSSSTDAVNGSQLYAVMQAVDTNATNISDVATAVSQMASNVNKLGKEVVDVGAESAALAALKSIAYDPANPTQFMAGVGTYRGHSVGAIGFSHYTSDKLEYHMGTTLGSTHNMMNAGVTIKFGSSSGVVPMTATEAARQLADLKSQVAELRKQNEAMSKQNAEMTKQSAANSQQTQAINQQNVANMAKLQSDNAKLQADNTKLQSDVQTLHQDNEQLRADNAKLRADNEETKAKLDMIMKKLGLS